MVDADRRLSGALMRVNHVGEVCAQALYQAQALTASRSELRQSMQAAARDEIDHLAWTEQRLRELGDRQPAQPAVVRRLVRHRRAGRPAG